MEIARLRCGACEVGFEGAFLLPRLARLSPDSLMLAEQWLLSGGNLKTLAACLEISYPTLRKRVDGLIAELNDLVKQDERKAADWLDAVDRGEMGPEEAARHMRELNGGPTRAD